MLKKNFLMSPGPSKVPEDVLLDMAQPMFHHRTPRYQEIFSEVISNLKKVFRTENDIFVYSASGTGGLEASMTSFLSPGDKVITVNGGKFGERFGLIGKAYGVDCDVIDVEWGKSIQVGEIESRLKADDSIKAVYTTLSETSTGVLNDLEAIGKVVANSQAILVCDAVSGLGADKLETDLWNVDVVISGSQKALMLPPGLAFMSVSKKAYALAEQSKIPAFYFDLNKYKKSLDKNDVPWTPAISLVVGLQTVLKQILDEGMENVWKRHAKLAEATREAMLALNLNLLAENPSNGVTSVFLPESVDGAKFVKYLRDDLGITVAGGQEHLKGKIFRIAHMGYCNQFDMVVGISAIEEGLNQIGIDFKIGKGLSAFQKAWLK